MSRGNKGVTRPEVRGHRGKLIILSGRHSFRLLLFYFFFPTLPLLLIILFQVTGSNKKVTPRRPFFVAVVSSTPVLPFNGTNFLRLHYIFGPRQHRVSINAWLVNSYLVPCLRDESFRDDFIFPASRARGLPPLNLALFLFTRPVALPIEVRDDTGDCYVSLEVTVVLFRVIVFG